MGWSSHNIPRMLHCVKIFARDHKSNKSHPSHGPRAPQCRPRKNENKIGSDKRSMRRNKEMSSSDKKPGYAQSSSCRQVWSVWYRGNLINCNYPFQLTYRERQTILNRATKK